MATGVPSAHPPYKRMIDGDISDYICSDHVPKTVHDELFVLRKPGDMKVAHLDAWLSLLKDRQEKYLRREVDEILRFTCTKAEPILKPAIYDPDFMRAYALEHGPMYEPRPAPPTVNLVNSASESQGSHEANADGLSAQTAPTILDSAPAETRRPNLSEVPPETGPSNSNPVSFAHDDIGSSDYEEDQQVDDYLVLEYGTGDSREHESEQPGIGETQNRECGRAHGAEVGEIVLLAPGVANQFDRRILVSQDRTTI